MFSRLLQERDLRENQDTRRTLNISELVAAKDKEKQYRFELEQMRELLKHEQERTKRLMEEVVKSSKSIVIYPSLPMSHMSIEVFCHFLCNYCFFCQHRVYRKLHCKISCNPPVTFITQVGKQEHAKKAVELNSSTIRSRLAELESSHQNHETDNAQLRRDKMLLVDHVADLQKRVSVLKSSFWVIWQLMLFYIETNRGFANNKSDSFGRNWHWGFQKVSAKNKIVSSGFKQLV